MVILFEKPVRGIAVVSEVNSSSSRRNTGRHGQCAKVHNDQIGTIHCELMLAVTRLAECDAGRQCRRPAAVCLHSEPG